MYKEQFGVSGMSVVCLRLIRIYIYRAFKESARRRMSVYVTCGMRECTDRNLFPLFLNVNMRAFLLIYVVVVVVNIISLVLACFSQCIRCSGRVCSFFFFLYVSLSFLHNQNASSQSACAIDSTATVSACCIQ